MEMAMNDVNPKGHSNSSVEMCLTDDKVGEASVDKRNTMQTGNIPLSNGKEDGSYLSGDAEDDAHSTDILSMINTLLDEDTGEPQKAAEVKRDRTSVYGPTHELNCLVNGNCAQSIPPRISTSLQTDFSYRNYRPPSQVKVQINCNGQQTITSTSLQNFRRLIGLKDSPKKQVNNSSYRRSVRNNEYNHRNAFTNLLCDGQKIQNHCATRFAFRFGRPVCDELKNCLLNLRKLSASREACAYWLSVRPWMPRHIDYLNLHSPTECCCMIDWLIFEFLKEYCNTNDVLKRLDQLWGVIVDSDFILNMMRDWFDRIKTVDQYRRTGFCECSSNIPSITPEKARIILKCLNQSTASINEFITSVAGDLRGRLMSPSMFTM